MGVYVKGMEMPETCIECMNSGLRTAIRCTEWTEISAGLRENHRALSCHLTEVPEPHGDLIDRDEVRNAVFHHLSIKGEENLLPAEKSVFGNIIKAKPVIEAEGTNEGSN